MSLSVGIHNDVVVEPKVGEVNGAPVLNVVLSQSEGGDDLFDFASASTEGGSAETTSITQWPLKTKGLEDGKLVEDRKPASIMADYKDQVAFRTALLEAFGVDKNSIEWDPFRGLEVNTDVIRANPAVLKDDVLLAQMTKNLNQQTVEYYNQLPEEDKQKKFRVALVRRSKKDHNPKLRDRYLNKTPMLESMEVPADQSKVGFTAGEIKAGLDSATPLDSDPSGTAGVDATFGIKDPAGVPSNL